MSNLKIHPPPGVNWKSSTAADLSTDAGRRTTEDVWRCAQRGLVYPSPHAVFVTFFQREHLESAMTKGRLGKVLADARHTIHEQFPEAHTTAILGVGFGLWYDMSVADGTPLPDGMRLQFAAGADKHGHNYEPSLRSALLHPQGVAFTDWGAGLWFHIKSDQAAHCEGVMAWIRHRLEATESWADGPAFVWRGGTPKSSRPPKRGGQK